MAAKKRESSKVRIKMREKLTKAQDGICAYCNRPIKGKPSLDHVVPVDLGGDTNNEANLVVCCVKCNKSKGNRVVFTNLYDRIVYPLLTEEDLPNGFFQAKYIQTNKFKEK